MYESAPLTQKQKRFYGMISNIDDNFGRLVSYLKQTGKFDNTIIIFTTDNGTAAGISRGKDGTEMGYNSGLRGTKGSHYDGGHRVPFFMSWPKGDILQNTTINELTAHVDLLPTLTDLVGISQKPKKPLDGRSIATILRGEEKKINRMLVIDTQRNQWPEKGKNSCVMSTDWRLIDGEELYNVVDDPGQQNDMAKEYPDIVSEMLRFYDQWWASVEPDMEYAEIPLGNEAANPVLITIHDMHTAENIPWNQVQIRKGEFYPIGYYSVKVEEEGEYRFKLYRYPLESGLALSATVHELPEMPFRDGLPKASILDISKAKIQIGDISILTDVDANKPFVELKTKLSTGSYQLKSTFITLKGEEIPSYYIQIEKI